MIFKLLGVAAVGVVAYGLLKAYKPEYAVLSEVGCAAALFFLISGELESVTAFFTDTLSASGIDLSFSGILLKTLGVALVTQFAADAARDNAQQALAQKIEFAGKVLILALALPVLKAILQMISEFSRNL